MPCIADDSGFSVDALNGERRLFRARYAPEGQRASGPCCRSSKACRTASAGRIYKRDLLRVPERRRAGGRGLPYGSIARECRGTGGFGYDPIFLCAEAECAGKTFGEASPEERTP